MNTVRAVAWMLGTALLSAGCHLPAQVAWSPDGKMAGYRVGDKAYVIDENGKVIEKLGNSMGGLAWTADSKTLYFAASAEDGEKPAPTEASTRWAKPPATQPAQPAEDKEKAEAAVSVATWSEGKIKTLFSLADPVVYMELSPDQKWLALVTMHTGQGNGKEDDSRTCLYLYNIVTKQLDLLSEACRPALCFTGPHRLVSVEVMPETKEIIAQIVERDLDEKAAELKAVPLVDTLGPFTQWVAAAGEDVLFTALPHAFPGQPIDENNVPPHKLYQYTRKNKGIAAIADNVGERFLPGPDGKRILFEKITPAARDKPAQRHLAIMNANGSDARNLMELTEAELPVWPAWKDVNQISFQSAKFVQQGPVGGGGEQARWYDLVLYRIDPTGLTAVRTLSSTWEMEMTPRAPVRKTEEPTTQPATKP